MAGYNFFLKKIQLCFFYDFDCFVVCVGFYTKVKLRSLLDVTAPEDDGSLDYSSDQAQSDDFNGRNRADVKSESSERIRYRLANAVCKLCVVVRLLFSCRLFFFGLSVK